jgi:hypothetical protein
MAPEDLDTQSPVAGNGATNGHAPPRAPLPPAGRNTSIKPAMIVLLLAVGILVIFGAMALFSGQQPTTSTAPSAPVPVRGTTLLAVPAVTALKPIEQPGTPPGNIMNALTMPVGAVAHGSTDNSTSAGQYDEEMRFSLAASEDAVVTFFKTELAAKGWKIESVGPATNAPGSVEVLAQKAGDDGWYWEAGAVVSPTTFPNGGASGAESTAFTLRLFQVSDES